ncbi:aspartate/glutamate racemase family protein [Xenorhabdus thuongxuanensis]|uniref:aspartate/glutamate racemase family protein n=1 Tax=Xenorhabdus thuongxuanensis TaxID=1873484 RepID=UPI000AD8FD0C|nr:aspartate/glutamate racemase family protein [Xenorhabdus thuongxuanensis]
MHIADCALKKITTGDKKVAIIGTEPTIDAGFYQARIHAAGKEPVLSEELRKRTTELIILIKEKGFENKDVMIAWDLILSCVEALTAYSVFFLRSNTTRNARLTN